MDTKMSAQTKKEVLGKMQRQYAAAGLEYKQQLIARAVELLGYHRKSAIRALNRPQPRTALGAIKTGRPREYDPEKLLGPLKAIWSAAQQPCSLRLVAALPDWLPAYEEHHGKLPTDVRESLLKIGARTLDRLLWALHSRSGKGRGGTKPGTLLRRQIPIRGGIWDEDRPGFLEIDTVALCGGSLAGSHVWMVDGEDICTTWMESRAIWNRGEANTLEQIQDIEERLPFPLLGVDSDNGGEFINHHLVNYLQQRPRPVKFTRSRPYHKNDNAHIEQKNYTHVRQWFGYERYDNPEVVALLNQLTTGVWGQLLNFFCPTLKLKEKIRQGSRTIRKYDPAQTPYARVMANEHVCAKKKMELKKLRSGLNPFVLQEQAERELKKIFRLRSSRKT